MAAARGRVLVRAGSAVRARRRGRLAHLAMASRPHDGRGDRSAPGAPRPCRQAEHVPRRARLASARGTRRVGTVGPTSPRRPACCACRTSSTRRRRRGPADRQPRSAPTPPASSSTSVPADERRADLPSLDLTTIRVAEFSIAWAGPLAGRFLADFGLDVVKVEHPASRGIETASAISTHRRARMDVGHAGRSADPRRDLSRCRSWRALLEPLRHLEQDEPGQAQPGRGGEGAGRQGCPRAAALRRRRRAAQLLPARRGLARDRPVPGERR